MKVSDIMRTQFISFRADDTLEHVVRTFAKERITSAPVFDGDDFVGVASEIGIVDYFRPKKFLFLWKRDKPTPMEELKNATAGKIAKKSRVMLNSDDELSSVLSKIVKRSYCLPVMENGVVVGVVREDDLVSFFLKEFAKDSVAEEQMGLEMRTEIDHLWDIVKRDGSVTAKNAAKELGVSVKTAEALGKCLHNHNLISMKYSFMRGAVFERFEHEKK